MSATKKILIVEDDAVMTNLLRDFLSRQGYEVVACASVPEAQPLLPLKGTPACDLVISDVLMKPVDGMRFLRATHEEHPNLPIILISAFGSPELEREALRKGARGFLTKPFALSQIASLVRRELTARKSRDLKAH